MIEINSVSGEIFALSSPVHTTTTTIIISAHWEMGIDVALLWQRCSRYISCKYLHRIQMFSSLFYQIT